MMPIDALRECVRADFALGFVFWLPRPEDHFKPGRGALWNRKLAGTRADEAGAHGYREVRTTWNGQRLRTHAHRVVWALATGSWPLLQMDHINRVRDDNRLCNLREVTARQNHLNRTPMRPGMTGTRATKSGRFDSICQIDGKQKYIGTFDTVEEAHAAHLAAYEGAFA